MNEAVYIVKHGLYSHFSIETGSLNFNCYGWFISETKSEFNESIECSEETLKIIGNIYQTPELLTSHETNEN